MAEQHQIGELRQHLFDTLKDLRDKEKPVDRERVELTVAVAEQIINTGKLEVDAERVARKIIGTGFLPESPKGKLLPSGADDDDGLTEAQRGRLEAARARDRQR
jgi:hypothetical protein